MKSDSEEESGNTILFEKKSPTGAARQAREAREKQLRDMMDDEGTFYTSFRAYYSNMQISKCQILYNHKPNKLIL
jgi:hypothetical protein